MNPSHVPQVPRSAGMTTQEYAYLRLRNAVMVGALRPGTALTFRGLAQQLDLSPTPIREAVRRLSSESAIEVLGNRRLRIPEMTPGRFDELVQLRIALECHAAERAFPHLSDVAIARLREVDDAMDSAMGSRDLDALTRMNHDFHRILYTLNPDQVAMSLIESVWLQLGPFQRRAIERLESDATADHHKEMLAAMEARDAAALRAAITSDISDGSIRLGRRMLEAGAEQGR